MQNTEYPAKRKNVKKERTKLNRMERSRIEWNWKCVWILIKHLFVSSVNIHLYSLRISAGEWGGKKSHHHTRYNRRTLAGNLKQNSTFKWRTIDFRQLRFFSPHFFSDHTTSICCTVMDIWIIVVLQVF